MKMKLFFIAMLSTVVLSSCLKSDDPLGFEADKGSITSGIFDKSYYGDAKPYVLNLNPLIENLPDFLSLRFSAPRQNKPANNIHIKISVANSAALVAAYNSAHGTSFVNLPTNAYTLTSLEYDIPKDGGEILVPFTLNKNNINLANAYAIGINVTEVSEGVINELEKELVVTFQVKNKYDGVYKLNLRLDNWEAYGISSGIADDFPNEVSLITAGANSVTISHSGGSNLQPGFTGGVGSITGATQFGAASPKYAMDLATDKVSSVVNTTPDDGRGRTFFLDPATTTSAYNPATKVLYIEYVMTQTGRPDMKIKSRYTYLRSR